MDANSTDGLFRTVLAGRGQSLAEAFAQLTHAPPVERLLRYTERNALSARVSLRPQEGHGYWELTRIREDFYVIVENFAYKESRRELVPGDGLIQFNFKLSGDMSLGVDHAQPLRFNRPSLLVWSQPIGVDIDEWTAPRAYERNVAISVRPRLLCEQFLGTTNDMPARLRALVEGDDRRINYCQGPMTAQMFDAVTRLIENPLTGARALIYIEAITLELLSIAVETLRPLSNALIEEYTDRELRCLHASRDLLMQQATPSMTVKQLSRKVGIAQTTLRQGFKSVFGETLVDFRERCRMQRALILLRDRRWSVEKVAEAVGYSHPTSFATAFRRHFDMRPIDVRHVKPT